MSEILSPINAFQPKMQEIINHYSQVKGYPAEYFITGLLSAASTAMGRSVTLSTGNYTAIGIIWAAIVGKPGVIKSEALTDAFKPLKSVQFEYFRQHALDTAELEARKASNPKDKTELAEPRKFLLSDITPEALSMTLAANPKGCGILYDELAGFVGRFNRYNSGADEQMFLSLFNGDTIIRTRVNGHGNAAVKNTFVTIAGTIQPSVMKKVFADKADSGFFDRWLLSYPDNLKKQYPNAFGVNSKIEEQYQSVIEKLLSLDYDEFGLQSMVYNSDSFAIISKYQCELIDTQNETENDNYRSILAKMEIYLHRFSLLLQCIIYASEKYTDPLDLNFVSVDAANGAIILTEYFISEANKMRIIDPVEYLKDVWIDIYKALPSHGKNFDRSHFVKVCEKFGKKQRQADNFLKENAEHSEYKLFFKVNHGLYTKNIF